MDDVEAPVSIKYAALAGVGWTATARLIAEVSAFGSALVIARVVSPADFGRASLAIVLATLADAVTRQGMGSAVVQRKTASEELIGTAFVMSLAIGCLLAAVVALVLAPVLGATFGTESRGLVLVLAAAFVFSGLGSVPMAVLQRRLAFREMSMIDAAASVVGAAVAIVLAVAGVGALALVVGVVSNVAVMACGALLRAPRIPLRLSRVAARDLVTFGVPAAGSSLLFVAVQRVDYALVGARLGPVPLGNYVRAYQLGSEYQGKVTSVMTTMALPLYARARSHEELRELRAKITRLHATTLLPMLFLVAATAPVLVPTLFGPDWGSAVVPTRILTVAGLTATMGAGAGALITALGRPGAMLRYTAFELVVIAGAVLLLAPYGLVVVSAGVAVARVVLLAILLRFVIQPIAGIPAWKSLRDDAGPAVAAGILMGVAAAACVAGLTAGGMPDIVALAAAVVLGLAVYVAVLQARFPAALSDVKVLARRLTAGRLS